MILYVAGYGRSGSTIFGKYLSEATGAIFIGEAYALCDNSKSDLISKEYLGFIRANGTILAHIAKLDCFICASYNQYLYQKYLKSLTELFDSDCIVDSSKTTFDTFKRPYNLVKAGYPVIVFLLDPGIKVIIKRMIKGKNSDLERGIKKRLVLRLMHIPIVFMHYFLAVSIWKLIYYKKLNIVHIKEKTYSRDLIDKFVGRQLICRKSGKVLPPIYGNRLRNQFK